MTTREKVWHIAESSLTIRSEASDLPPGVVGRVSGVALTYDVVDSYDTMFARACAKRSIDQRVSARKVPLLMDHERSTRAHVGVVAAMEEVGDSLVMVADIFDTEEGRSALEYVKAVLAAGADTGFSIGFIPRRSETVRVADKSVERFTEIELREVSLTPMPAVPGAQVSGARNDQPLADERSEHDILTIAARAALDALPKDLRHAVVQSYLAALAPDSAPDSSDVSETPAATDAPGGRATMEDRIKAIRSSYAPIPTRK
jgi:HK97 family phage prohead protease